MLLFSEYDKSLENISRGISSELFCGDAVTLEIILIEGSLKFVSKIKLNDGLKKLIEWRDKMKNGNLNI